MDTDKKTETFMNPEGKSAAIPGEESKHAKDNREWEA